MQLCIVCRVEKPWEAFSKRKQNHSGFDTRCKSCMSEKYKRYRAAHRSEVQDREHRVRYGIGLSEREALIRLQDGRCAICKCIPSGFHLDHDHVTDRVRGMLCQKCNHAIGLLQDDPKIIESALHYVLRGGHVR